MEATHDVIVLGTGNAALCAALAAHEAGAKVLIVEKAPIEARGGNSLYTMGVFRMTVESIEELRTIVPSMTDADEAGLEGCHYNAAKFTQDLVRASDGFADPALTKLLVDQSFPVARWMTTQGVDWDLAMAELPKGMNRQQVWRFAPGVWSRGEGRGLLDRLFATVEKEGIEIRYRTGGEKLIVGDDGRVKALRVKTSHGFQNLACKAVILASGGFEANQELRARYLGPDYVHIKVRGSKYNTGAALTMALEIGAQGYGDWAGAHAIPIDGHAPAFEGLREHGERTRRCLYQFGIMVNEEGKRFVDEGEDLTVQTYAKTGIAVQRQKGARAYQIFDSRWEQAPVERDFYALTEPSIANTIGELAEKIRIPRDALEAEIDAYNKGIDPSKKFDFTKLDGCDSKGLAVPRSNWARAIEKAPFFAFPISGGITFTYGGLKIDLRCQVLDTSDQPIGGLYAAGETTGGFFHKNYFGGAGLMRGSVTGYFAGRSAAEDARKR